MKNFMFVACFGFSCSVFLLACTTTPKEARDKIQTQNLAGYWVSYKYDFGANKAREVEEFVKISCDGAIEYKIKDNMNLILPKDSDEGTIQSIEDGQIKYKSWTGATRSRAYETPIKDKNGCWSIRFEKHKLKETSPVDCTQPKKSFMVELDDALRSTQNGAKNQCL